MSNDGAPRPPVPDNHALTELGAAALAEADLTAVVVSALGHLVRLSSWTVDRLATSDGAIGTDSVFRLHGTAIDLRLDSRGTEAEVPWSVLLKVLRSARHWPGIGVVPVPFRQSFVDGFRWQVEADVLRSDLPGRLPLGLRMPRVLRIDDLGDDRIALWLEFIETDSTPWAADKFAAAAVLLGRWAGRFSGDRMAGELGADMSSGLAEMAAGRLAMGIFPQLADDVVWAQPMLRAAVDADLRGDLLTLAGRVPGLLQRLDRLPKALCHGDACPQNLLVPADRSATFVAIDVSWQRPEAVGFDLAQLLMGAAQAGTVQVDDLDELRATVLAAYLEGLRLEGWDQEPEVVRFGFDASMVLRSAFTSLPLVEQPDDQLAIERCAQLAQRAALTRYLVDIGLALPD